MTVELTTFGYKAGAPADGDLIVDVRSLPNPFYEPELKALTGCDAAIAAFFASRDDVAGAVEEFNRTIRAAVDASAARGAATARIAIGCTGGQHRSVYVAEHAARRLRADGFDVTIKHRELAPR
jgi:UPF0042 nucleotide-binding protein